METTLVSTILSYVPDNAIALVAVVVLYLIINKQRSNTKTARDSEAESMKAEIAVLKAELEQIKALDLASRLASIETSLKYIQMLLEEKREK